MPAFANELDLRRGQTKKGIDTVEYIFKNGSKIDILAARESSRGQRRHGIVGEEFILIDQDALNEIIIPTTVINRFLPDGSWDPKEVVNQSQTYISTAGFKNTFAYELTIEHLIRSIIEPDEVMILGGTYNIPVLEGLQPEDFLAQLKMSGTYNEDSFDREYLSKWTGDAENAFFPMETFDKHRSLLQPEREYSGRSSRDAYYVLGVDVGRFECTTEICVFKVTPQPQGSAVKSLVNMYTYEAEDFEQQAIKIKKLYYLYKAKVVALDANGVGAGLVDFMTKMQIDPDTGEELMPFGIEGGTFEDWQEQYKMINKGAYIEKDAMYLIKANAPINTETYSYIKTQMFSGKVKMLIDPQTARAKLGTTKVGQQMGTAERNEYLVPFELTERLKEQIGNLIQENDGTNIILKQNNRGIAKDKFSAFGYGLYYIKQNEDTRNRRRKFSMANMMFHN